MPPDDPAGPRELPEPDSLEPEVPNPEPELPLLPNPLPVREPDAVEPVPEPVPRRCCPRQPSPRRPAPSAPSARPAG